MGSLRNCLGKAKKFISKEDADDIREAYEDYIDAKMPADEAARKAVQDVIARAMEERADIVAQIEKAGGVVPALEEYKPAESKKPAAEPTETEPERTWTKEGDEAFSRLDKAEKKLAGWKKTLGDPKKFQPIMKGEYERAFDVLEKAKDKAFKSDPVRFLYRYPGYWMAYRDTMPSKLAEMFRKENEADRLDTNNDIRRVIDEYRGIGTKAPEPDRAEPIRDEKTKKEKTVKWLETLDEDQRQSVFAEMRRLDDRAEANLEKSRDLTPGHGEVAVGGAHMDYFIPGESIAQFLRLLRRGNTPDVAAKGAKEYARDIVAKWNKQRGNDVHTHRWKGTADNLIEDAERSIRNAAEAISEKEKPSAEIFQLPERMTRESLSDLAERVASMSDAEKKQVGQWISDQFDRLERDGKRIEKHCLGAGKKFSIK